MPQQHFVRMVRSALDQFLSVSEDHLVPYHIPTTRVFAASRPKIKDVLCNHMDMVQTWASDGTTEQAGWKCCCADIVQLVDGHVACSASLLTLPEQLSELATSSANNSRYPLTEGAWATLRRAVTKWTQDHGLLCIPTDDLRDLWEPAWTQHEPCIGDKWTVSDVLRLKKSAPGLIWHVRDH